MRSSRVDEDGAVTCPAYDTDSISPHSLQSLSRDGFRLTARQGARVHLVATVGGTSQTMESQYLKR